MHVLLSPVGVLTGRHPVVGRLLHHPARQAPLLQANACVFAQYHGPFSSSSYGIGSAPTLILRKGFLNS